MALDGANGATIASPLTGDITEVAVGDADVRVAVAGDVESVKGIEAEAEVCSRKMWKSLNADMSTLRYPGPRTLPLLRCSKRYCDAGAPNAQTPLSHARVVHGVADGSVPNQLSMRAMNDLQLAVLIRRESCRSYWSCFPAPVIVSGNPL